MKNLFKFTVFLLLILFNFSCKNHPQTKKEKSLQNQLLSNFEGRKVFFENAQNAIDEYLKNLSLEEKVFQLFVINLDGNENFVPVEFEDDVDKSYSHKKPLIPGGYLFFSYNISKNPQKIIEFTDSIKNFAIENKITPPYLSIDQEGGSVNRLRGISGALPSQARITEKLSVEEAYELYSYQAKELKLLGFNLNFSPVTEILNLKNQDFLGDRSFGSKTQVVSYGRSAINAFQNQGIASVIKHFPGNTNVDPHSGLPEIDWSNDELKENLFPFKVLSSVPPAGILMSHARIPLLDAEPACLSEKWISSKLISDFNYKGIVFSDDIYMAALSKNGYSPEKASVMAINAGVNSIMISEKRFSKAAKVLILQAEKDENFKTKIENSVRKLIDFKIKAGILKFKTENEKLVLVAEKNSQSVQDRVSEFENEKVKNVNFYWQKFDPR